MPKESLTRNSRCRCSALRIVTLAPHLTEMVYTVGAGDNLVGVVAYSDYPEQARSLPVIGDAFRIDPERLAAVEPNLILAWQGGNPDAGDRATDIAWLQRRLVAGRTNCSMSRKTL